jgi:hypothetical protein
VVRDEREEEEDSEDGMNKHEDEDVFSFSAVF